MAGPISASGVAHAAMDAISARPDAPRLVIVGIGGTVPKTTQSLLDVAAARGLEPGRDVLTARYRDLRVGVDRGFVRLVGGEGSEGTILAGKGQQSLFLFRGGGNLRTSHFNTIEKVQSVEGATALTDLDAIRRLGSKSATNEVLERAGAPLAATIPVHGVHEATGAFDEITGRFGAEVAVLKKVNSLGGKDVHFVRSHDDIRTVIDQEPDADFVMQEFLPAAKDQDVRVHGVWNHETGTYDLPHSYVRNRAPFHLTPNLANGGFPTHYVLSPWEEQQVLRSMHALAEGSAHPPLHVGLDLFPRRPITASTVERNAQLQEELRAARTRPSVLPDPDTVVIGEAATSAGTKGTELVLGSGVNPVADRIIDAVLHLRGEARPSAVADAMTGAGSLQA